MLETICQWAIVVHLFLRFLTVTSNALDDKAQGTTVSEVLFGCVLGIALMALLFWGAGAFDQLLGPK